MKVLGICGSPRIGGNTEYFINITLDELEKHDISTEIIRLGEKEVKPCKGCYGCVKAGKCTQTGDDFDEIFAKMLSADGILVGSPVYNSSATPNIKALLDRAGFVARWSANAMKEKSENYDWKGTAFSGKVAAPITVARRSGQSFAFAQLLLALTVNDFMIIGSHYWNVGVAGKGGAVDAENDEEGIGIMKHLAENMAHVLKKLHA